MNILTYEHLRHYIGRKNQVRISNRDSGRPHAPTKEDIRENLETKKDRYARRCPGNLKRYKKVYKGFFARGGSSWYESLTGEAVDESRIFLDIDYFTSILAEGVNIEERIRDYALYVNKAPHGIREKLIEVERKSDRAQRDKERRLKADAAARNDAEAEKLLNNYLVGLKDRYNFTIETREEMGRKALWMYYSNERSGPPTYRSLMQQLATPPWASLDKIKGVYLKRDAATKKTGIAHAVDHIIPIVNPLVCGLHTYDNLQVITAKANSSKSNKFNI